MKPKGERYVLAGIMAVMIALIVSSLAMPEVESKAFPLVFAGIVLILTSVALSRELCARPGPGAKTPVAGGDGEGSKGEDRESWRGYLVHIAWVAGFILTLYLLGFVIAVPSFILAYMKRLGNGWLAAIISAGAFTLAIVFGLGMALEVELPTGLFLSWVGG